MSGLGEVHNYNVRVGVPPQQAKNFNWDGVINDIVSTRYVILLEAQDCKLKLALSNIRRCGLGEVHIPQLLLHCKSMITHCQHKDYG